MPARSQKAAYIAEKAARFRFSAWHQPVANMPAILAVASSSELIATVQRRPAQPPTRDTAASTRWDSCQAVASFLAVAADRSVRAIAGAGTLHGTAPSRIMWPRPQTVLIASGAPASASFLRTL